MGQQAAPVQDTSKPRPSMVTVRYGYLGWVGQFRHDLTLKFKYGDRLVVKTERGLEIGTPMSASCSQTCSKCVRPEQTEAYVRASGEDYLQRNAGEIVRVATAEDIAEQRRIDAQAKEKLAFCGQAAIKANLVMKMVACEHLLGGERIIYYFTAEGRIDFRQLVRELAREYHTRIEMRQIGARDQARIVADLEICGRECCCKNFLKVLRPVNMKMAKMQKATLDPTKVSGRCGRLRCCLRYEQLTYEELDAKLPDVGIRVRVEQGIGVIRDRQVITQILVLDMGEGRRLAVPLEEVKEILGRAEGEDARPSRRRGRDEPDENGGQGRPRRGRQRSEQSDGDDQPVSRPPGADEEGDAPPPSGVDGQADGASVAADGEPATQESRQGQRPPGMRQRPERQRGRRDGRGPRQPGSEGQGDRERANRDPGQREQGTAPAAGRESPPGDARPDAPQGAGKQEDGEGKASQGRPGRRRRRRRR